MSHPGHDCQTRAFQANAAQRFVRYRRPTTRRPSITTDDLTLIGLGLGAVLVLWLVFSMIRKLFGLVLIGALALGAWYVWNDPELLARLTDMVSDFFS